MNWRNSINCKLYAIKSHNVNWRNSINCKLYAIKSHNLWSHCKLNNNKTIEYTTYCYGNKDYKLSVLLLHKSYQLSSSPQQEHLANFCHELSFTWLQCTIHRNQFVIQVSIKPNNIYLQRKKDSIYYNCTCLINIFKYLDPFC